MSQCTIMFINININHKIIAYSKYNILYIHLSDN